MPDGVIAAVERMADDEGQPLHGPGAPLFEWAPGVPIADEIHAPFLQDDGHVEVTEGNNEDVDDILYDGDIGPGEEDDRTDEEYAAEEVATETDEQADAEYVAEDHLEEQRSENDEQADAEHVAEDHLEEQRSESGNEPVDDEYGGHDEQESEFEDDQIETDEGYNEIPEEGYNLRPNRVRNYNGRLAEVMDNPASNQSYDAQLLQHDGGDFFGLRGQYRRCRKPVLASDSSSA